MMMQTRLCPFFRFYPNISMTTISGRGYSGTPMEFFRKRDEKGLFDIGKETYGSVEVISAIIYISL